MKILLLIYLVVLFLCILEAYFCTITIEEETEYTCCNIEITQEIKDNGICPKCLEHL